jgi:hypothetical protein
MGDLLACGGRPVAMGVLAGMRETPGLLATRHIIPLEALAVVPGVISAPDECPICANGHSSHSAASGRVIQGNVSDDSSFLTMSRPFFR